MRGVLSAASSYSFIRIQRRTIWEISCVYLYSLMLGSSAAVTNAFFTAVCVDIAVLNEWSYAVFPRLSESGNKPADRQIDGDRRL